MRTSSALIPRPVIVIPPAALRSRLLFCIACDAWTRHALTRTEEHYVCGCGASVIYIVNDKPALWAIR